MFRVVPLIVALAFPLPAYAWPGTVLDVHDGDTMTVAPMGDVRVPIKLRLYGIDAPEAVKEMPLGGVSCCVARHTTERLFFIALFAYYLRFR